MPSILASAIISKAQTILQDTAGVRWTGTEGLGWLNDGQREIAALKPDAYTKIANIVLVNGTKQTIPADGVRLVSVLRNMGSGTTPGDAIRPVKRQALDANVPSWHSMAGAAVTQHYVVEFFAPKSLYVYPPGIAGNQIESLYEAVPPDVAAIGNVISLDDIYANPLIDYVLYRFFSKDAELPGMAERAILARKAFDNTLGLQGGADATAVTHTQS